MLLSDPFETLIRLQQALDTFRQSDWLESSPSGMGPYPPVNVFERPDEFLLTAELPGVRTEDLEISVSNGQLVLRGKRLVPSEPSPERYRRSERPHGEWERAIPLPDRVEEEQMSAEFVNGVLTVHLPKAPSTQPRQIPISETTT